MLSCWIKTFSMAWVKLLPWLLFGMCCAAFQVAALEPLQTAQFTSGDRLSHLVPPSWPQLRGRIGTVCVTGDDRIGKSTLLTLWGRSKLKSSSFRFSAGHTVDSHTRGMWSAILPQESTGLKYHLNLCDSQGLKQISEVEAYRLFSANVLIPSVLVYMVKDVVQNDQIRDLASYAHLFKNALAKDASGRIKQTLSPHLIVVIRDTTSLFGENPQLNQSAHLEKGLSGEKFAEEKALVKQVFSSREAWVLEELPKASRLALQKLEEGNAAPRSLPFHVENVDGKKWRDSGLVVLNRVLAAVDTRLISLPNGGPELIQWHETVFEVVNSKVDLVGRLSAFSEVLGTMKQRRAFLGEWRIYFQLMFAIVALLLAFGGFLGRWLDRVAWGVWLLLCICYIGSSPFITMSLHSFVPALCVQSSTQTVMMTYVCQELSAPTAAVLLAAVLGIVTYPLLTTLLSWLLLKMPLPRMFGKLNKQHASLLLSVAFAGLGLLENIAVAKSADTPISLGVRIILVVVAITAGAEFGVATRKNNKKNNASLVGRSLPHTAAVRFADVQTLLHSPDWVNFFRKNAERESLWRYRPEATWLHGSVCLQAGALLVWGHIIRPYFDPVLTVGAILNMLYLLWHGGASFVPSLCGKRAAKDPIDAWLESLPDANEDELSWKEEPDLKAIEPIVIDETEEEIRERRRIEAMRCGEECGQASGTSYMGIGCFFVIFAACAYHFARG